MCSPNSNAYLLLAARALGSCPTPEDTSYRGCVSRRVSGTRASCRLDTGLYSLPGLLSPFRIRADTRSTRDSRGATEASEVAGGTTESPVTCLPSTHEKVRSGAAFTSARPDSDGGAVSIGLDELRRLILQGYELAGNLRPGYPSIVRVSGVLSGHARQPAVGDFSVWLHEMGRRSMERREVPLHTESNLFDRYACIDVES